jgi:hypothetical protein
MGAALGSLVIISFAGSRSQQILWRKQVPLNRATHRETESLLRNRRAPPASAQSPVADVRPDGNF